MKYKYIFRGFELEHHSTIRKWLKQTFGNSTIIKSCPNGIRRVDGPWAVQRYWLTEVHIVKDCLTRPRREFRFIPGQPARLKVLFKKEKDLAFFILKFGHLMVDDQNVRQ